MNLMRQLVDALSWLPNWAIAVGLLMAAAGTALLLHRVTLRGLRRLVPERFAFLQSLIPATQGLIRYALVVIACALMLPALPLERDGLPSSRTRSSSR